MRTLVTGGAGFVSLYLVEQLLNDDHSVTVADDFSNGYREWIPGSARIIEDDLTNRPSPTNLSPPT